MATSINWSEFESRASKMTDTQLLDACKAIVDALPSADALDRATGQDRGGRYRDEISVYRSEQAKRLNRNIETLNRAHAAFGRQVLALLREGVDDRTIADYIRNAAEQNGFSV